VALIYKITSESLWASAQAAGVFEGAPVDLADGFIHFSTADQVQETADKHFTGQTDLLLAAFDADALGEALRWETSRGGQLFPHLFAPLPTSAAAWVRPIPLGADGKHDFSELLS